MQLTGRDNTRPSGRVRAPVLAYQDLVRDSKRVGARVSVLLLVPQHLQPKSIEGVTRQVNGQALSWTG